MDIRKQFLSDQHRILMGALQAREGDVLRLLGFLLPALAGFGGVVYAYAKGIVDSRGVVIGWLAMQCLLALGARYILALAYNFRYVLLQLRKVEDRTKGASKIVLAGWHCPNKNGCRGNMCKREKELLPEMFAAQHDLLWALLLASGAVPPLVFLPSGLPGWDLTLVIGLVLTISLFVLSTDCHSLMKGLLRKPDSFPGKLGKAVACLAPVALLVTASGISFHYYMRWTPLVVGSFLFLWLWWSAHLSAYRVNSIIKDDVFFSHSCRKEEPCPPFRRFPMRFKGQRGIMMLLFCVVVAIILVVVVLALSRGSGAV